MNISEANATAKVIKHVTGEAPVPADNLRDHLTYLADRAGKVLQLRIEVKA